MPKCTRPGHTVFKHGTCVECRKRRQREYQSEMRNARRLVKAINPQFNLSVYNAPQVML